MFSKVFLIMNYEALDEQRRWNSGALLADVSFNDNNVAQSSENN